MVTTVLIIHAIISVTMIIVILIQRAEGGALGIGGGQVDNMFSSRGVGDILTKITTVLAGCFFITSIILTILSIMQSNESVLDKYLNTSPSHIIETPAPLLPEAILPTPQ